MFLQVFLCSLLCLSPCLVQSSEIKNRTFVVVEPAKPVQLGECPSKWKYQNKDSENLISATQSFVGFYHCTDNEHLVYILARTPTKFTQVKASRTSWMTGENVTFNCHSTAYMGLGSRYSIKMKIIDPSGVQLDQFSVEDDSRDQKQLKITVDHSLAGYGIQVFFCTLHYFAEQGTTWSISHSEYKSLNVTVYQPPKNVKPDTLSVPVGKDVMCTSEGYPNPYYKWVCQGDGWTTNGENLTVNAESLTCTCNARAMINGKPYEGSWDGTIRGIGGGTKIFLTGILIIATAFAHLPDA